MSVVSYGMKSSVRITRTPGGACPPIIDYLPCLCFGLAFVEADAGPSAQIVVVQSASKSSESGDLRDIYLLLLPLLKTKWCNILWHNFI